MRCVRTQASVCRGSHQRAAGVKSHSYPAAAASRTEVQMYKHTCKTCTRDTHEYVCTQAVGHTSAAPNGHAYKHLRPVAYTRKSPLLDYSEVAAFGKTGGVNPVPLPEAGEPH